MPDYRIGQPADTAVTNPTSSASVIAALKGILSLLGGGGGGSSFSTVLEGGLTELVGINEQIDNADYSGSIGVALSATASGEILSIAFYATEDGSGAIQRPSGVLFVLDADPSVASGDTTLSAADGVTVLGTVDVAAGDWTAIDANVAVAHKAVSIPFHSVATLYFTWLHTSGTSFNDAAGDDEQLEFNFWYRRAS